MLWVSVVLKLWAQLDDYDISSIQRVHYIHVYIEISTMVLLNNVAQNFNTIDRMNKSSQYMNIIDRSNHFKLDKNADKLIFLY